MKVVDFAATKQAFKESGRAMSMFARAKGINPSTLRELLSGRMRYTEGEKYQAMIEALREAKVLVEVENGEERAA